jgi:hypothetical protein
MTPELLLAGLLALALLVAWARLVWWRARGEGRPAMWRFVALMLLQPVWLGLLYLMLLPPRLMAEQGRQQH